MCVPRHPDEATEAVVTQALAHGKPFAVVPCVFAHLSPHRTLEGRPVRSIDEFCRYLT